MKLFSTKLNVRGRVPQLVEELRHKTGGSGFNFQMADSFCPHSVALGSTQSRTEKSTEKFPWECGAAGAAGA